MATLEQRHFVSTEADIEALATDLSEAIEVADRSRGNYLKMVTATTKHDLGLPQTARRGKAAKLSDEDKAAQLAAAQAVHDRFYPVLTAKIAESIPKGKDHAKAVNRRVNFARTAFGALRNYLRAGKDLAALNPDTVTKASLRVDGPKRSRRVSPTVLRKRVEKQSTALMTQVLALAEADKAAAIGELELLVGQLAQQLNELNASRPTSDPDVAIREHRSLKVGRSMFVPVTQTQVIRQQERPS